MNAILTLRLPHNDVGQILDGLDARLQSWRATAEYLESGHAPSDDFIAEECHRPEEAAAIARHYQSIIAKIETQLRAPRTPRQRTSERRRKARPQTGYCVFMNTFFDGPTVAVRYGDNRPWVFASEREAQLDIVDSLKIQLAQFESGERDYEDAISIDEYVVPVTVLNDGSVLDEHGRTHGVSDA